MTDPSHEYLLNRVIESTKLTAESPTDAKNRATIVTRLFAALGPNDLIEATMACNIINLQFLMMAAMRDAFAVPEGQPQLALRGRSAAVTISRAQHAWLARLERSKAKREKAEIPEKQAAPVKATAVKPPPLPVHPKEALLPPLPPLPAQRKSVLPPVLPGLPNIPSGAFVITPPARHAP